MNCSLFNQIPGSWSSVTLYQFRELHNIDLDSLSGIELLIEQVSILLDLDPVDIGRMELTQLNQYASQLGWMNTLPKGDPFPQITLSGITFQYIPMKELTIGNWADLNEYQNLGIMDNLEHIISILYKPIQPITDTINTPQLFLDHCSVQCFYNAFNTFSEFRNDVLEKFSGLYDKAEPDEDDEPEEQYRTITGEKIKQDNSIHQKWNNYSLIYSLAGGDPLKMIEASRIPVLQALTFLSFKKEMKLE